MVKAAAVKAAAINLGLFKLGWLGCVFAAAAGMPGVGTFVIAAVVALHLALAPAQRRGAEALLLAAAAGLGLIWESVLVLGGVLDYGVAAVPAGLAPYWIVALWVLFATTINHGLRWLRRSTALAALAGAIGGPLAFAAGEGAGAVTLAHPVLSLLLIAIGWALLLPLLVSLAETVETRVAEPGREAA